MKRRDEIINELQLFCKHEMGGFCFTKHCPLMAKSTCNFTQYRQHELEEALRVVNRYRGIKAEAEKPTLGSKLDEISQYCECRLSCENCKVADMTGGCRFESVKDTIEELHSRLSSNEQKEITRILTVEITEIGQTDSEMFNEEALEQAIKHFTEADDVKVVKTQNFVRL